MSRTLPAPAVLELAAIYAGDRDLAALFVPGRGPRKPDDYAAFALAHRGDPGRGRSLFQDTRGLGCIKCHRVNGDGGEGGPDLSRVAANYGRAELIDSVLFPSKKVEDGFRTTTLAMEDGQVLSGLVIADDGERLVLVDGQGAKHDVRKSAIEQQSRSDRSPMPENLQAGLTPEEFADLIAYLETLTLPAEPAAAFEVTGLSHPVCFIVDPGTGDYFIANVNGATRRGTTTASSPSWTRGVGSSRSGSSARRRPRRCTPRRGSPSSGRPCTSSTSTACGDTTRAAVARCWTSTWRRIGPPS